MLSEYVKALRSPWRAAVTGVVALLIFTAGSAIGLNAWATLGLAAAVAIVMAQFLAWRDASAERDEARIELADRLSSLRYRLEMHRLQMTVSIHPGDNDGSPAIADFWVGVEFHNCAHEAMFYEIESMTVVVADKTVSRPTFQSTGATLPPGSTHTFRFPQINGVTVLAPLEGTMDYIAIYGHPSGGPRWRRHHKFSFEVLGDPGVGNASCFPLDIFDRDEPQHQ